MLHSHFVALSIVSQKIFQFSTGKRDKTKFIWFFTFDCRLLFIPLNVNHKQFYYSMHFSFFFFLHKKSDTKIFSSILASFQICYLFYASFKSKKENDSFSKTNSAQENAELSSRHCFNWCLLLSCVDCEMKNGSVYAVFMINSKRKKDSPT